ncbi:MAG: hypothetical protein ACXWPM_03835 [Bdellovibrionota bacterium]
MSSAKKVKWFGGLGSALAGSSVLFMKCPLCWLAMGTTAAATYWPVLALPALALVAFKLKNSL